MLFIDDTPMKFELPDADVTYYPHFFSAEESDFLMAYLLKNIAWQQDTIRVFNKTHWQPRLTAFYGDLDKTYRYSTIEMQPNTWDAVLLSIKQRIDNLLDTSFTSVLLNWYRNGKDSNGWHADNEKELGKNPIIASVSFGATRVFQLKHHTIKDAKCQLNLEHGSLLVMKGTTQHFWKHQIPKTSKPVADRVNLTFRILYSNDILDQKKQ
ncbi:alpha-ketoglutarate-dependent dioxygenase AlkB family protein [Flavobacterium branchiophilum]|uniref:Alpha-ketoglutarate-dependent dioxygenase AlkB n=1 Tax=Flavobacterium branchiophilum TaxID=55197 RepID=A0A2H3K8L0_9FLAO|nr:alpha-ketoglutarate-dependent dioxygenase AlkB [Flavobacterium branchiophilum]PDS22007.1 alpha-ketoglutarate-dependent dioxygenase AlkB [Flavobacterium branchiophilum]